MEYTLIHSGIKGMKWGVRRYQNKDGSLTPAGKKRYASELDSKREIYKSSKAARFEANMNKQIARERYNNSFNRAYTYSQNHPVRQYYGKGKAVSDQYWKDVKNDEESFNKAKAASKQANKNYRQAKRDYKEAKTNAKYEKYGLDPTNTDHIIDVYNHGYKGAQRILKRMERKNISNLKSSMIEVGREAAIGSLVTIGTLTTIGAITKYSNPTMQVLDAGGKVLKNFY